MFQTGQLYTRKDVQDRLGVPEGRRGGQWQNGYPTYDGQLFIFCNVGAPGRTGHDYPNQWDGEELIWTARTGATLDQPLMRQVASGGLPIHVFWRSNNEDARFTYRGRAEVLSAEATAPARFRFGFEPQAESAAFVPASAPPAPAKPGRAVGSSDEDLRRLLSRLALSIQQRIEASGELRVGQNPLRKGPNLSDILAALNTKWTEQSGRCQLCGGLIPLNPSNRLLQLSPDRIDSTAKTYAAENLHLTHLGCNLAKNNATMADWQEYLAMVRGLSAAPPTPQIE